MSQILAQIQEIWGRMTGLQRGLSMGLIALVVIGGLAAAFAGSNTQWRSIGESLPRLEAQKLLQKLDEAGIEYQLRDGGRSIDIPANSWDAVQSLVVKNDLLTKGEKRGFGMLAEGNITDTKAQLEHKRLIAMQEELEMAIARQQGIDDVTIYITAAKNHWTKEGSERAKAAVMLTVAPGYMVTPTHVESIVNFVANSVKELDPENVVVTDTNGLTLARPASAGQPANLAASEAERKARQLKGAAETALAQAFGPNKVIVDCTVDLDLEQLRTETNSVLPDTRMVMEEELSSTQNKGGSQGGAVSTAVVQTGGAGGGNRDSKSEDIKTKYDVGRTKTVRVKDVGGIQQLTVAVIADESLKPYAAAIEAQVKGAVGYRGDRGDTFGGVQFAPFVQPPEVAVPEPPSYFNSDMIWQIAKWVVTALVGFAMVFFVARSSQKAKLSLQAALAKTQEEKEKPLEARPDPKDTLREMVEKDTDTVSKLLRNWLYEPVGK